MNDYIIEGNIAHVRSEFPRIYRHKSGVIPSESEFSEGTTHLRALLSSVEISRHDPLDRAEKIIRAGIFKTFTIREGERVLQGREAVYGAEYLQLRDEADETLFGLAASDPKPIYGLASNVGNEFGQQYGAVRFIFRDSIRPLATLTADDSLNALTMDAPPIDARRSLLAAVPLDAAVIEVLGVHLGRRDFDLTDLLSCKSLDELQRILGLDYFEIQLHGDIGVSTIKRIEVKQGNILSSEVRQWAAQNNVSIQTLRWPPRMIWTSALF